MIVVQGGEENLLAKYLENLHSFSWLDNYDYILCDDTCWCAFTQNPKFIAKKLEDEISYGWDSIVNRAHDGTSDRYERVARELARPDRFMRRILSKSFLDAYFEYMGKRPPILRRMMPIGDTTYCFLFMEDGEGTRERRKAMLALICFVARGLPPMNTRVIGVATEAANRSYDYCVRIQPEWDEEDEKNKRKVQEEMKIFLNPRITKVGEDEHPRVS
jgi:hypothetical protein